MPRCVGEHRRRPFPICHLLSELVPTQFVVVPNRATRASVVRQRRVAQLSLRRKRRPSLTGGEILKFEVFTAVTMKIQSHFATDGRSVSMSWCRAPSGAHDQMFVNFLKVTVLSY
jgi:hypothetical protein